MMGGILLIVLLVYETRNGLADLLREVLVPSLAISTWLAVLWLYVFTFAVFPMVATLMRPVVDGFLAPILRPMEQARIVRGWQKARRGWRDPGFFQS